MLRSIGTCQNKVSADHIMGSSLELMEADQIVGFGLYRRLISG